MFAQSEYSNRCADKHHMFLSSVTFLRCIPCTFLLWFLLWSLKLWRTLTVCDYFVFNVDVNANHVTYLGRFYHAALLMMISSDQQWSARGRNRIRCKYMHTGLWRNNEADIPLYSLGQGSTNFHTQRNWRLFTSLTSLSLILLPANHIMFHSASTEAMAILLSSANRSVNKKPRGHSGGDTWCNCYLCRIPSHFGDAFPLLPNFCVSEYISKRPSHEISSLLYSSF